MNGAPARRRAAALETARPGAAPPPARPLAATNPAGAAKALTKEELVRTRGGVVVPYRFLLPHASAHQTRQHPQPELPFTTPTGGVCAAAQGRAGAGAGGARRPAARRQAGCSQQVSATSWARDLGAAASQDAAAPTATHLTPHTSCLLLSLALSLQAM